MKVKLVAHKPVTTREMKAATDTVRCLLSNAAIDLPRYSGPAFRLLNIREAIERLQGLEKRLAVDAVIESARVGK